MKTSKLLLLMPLLLFLITGCEKELNDSQLMSDDLELRSATVTHDDYTLYIEETVPHFCTGEPILIKAYYNFKIKEVLDGNGGSHGNLKIRGKGTLTGLDTGWNYISNYILNEVSYSRDNDQLLVINSKLLSNLIVPGVGFTGMVRATFKVTISPEGKVTASIDKFEVVC